jgi:hypothetical protein
MANATKLFPIDSIILTQLSRPGAENPRLSQATSKTSTTLKFTNPLLDTDGNVITKAMFLGIKNDQSYVENCLIPTGSLAYDAQTANFTVGKVLTGGTSGATAMIVSDTDGGTTGTLYLVVYSGTFQNDETITDEDGGSATVNGTLTQAITDTGLTANGVIRGIDLNGLDWVTSNSSLAVTHKAGDAVSCNISGVFGSLMLATMNGSIATGGAGFVIGTEPGASGEVTTLYRTTTPGVTKGFLRWSSDFVQFSNDGTNWINNTDVSASVLLKISAADTTAGYGEDKLVAGDNVTITKQNTGGNETLSIAASSQREGVTEHETYTPAFLTSGGSIETNISLWDSLSDMSFRATDIDGTAYNVDGIDATASGPLGIVTSMTELAALLQLSLRAATGGSETVTWGGATMVFTSGDTTSSSAFAVLTTSTGTVGTDISGAGAGTWLDSDTGNGVATAAVIDPTADEGKVALLDDEGNISSDFLGNAIAAGLFTAKGSIVSASAADTPVEVTVGSNGKTVVADSTVTAGVRFGGNVSPLILPDFSYTGVSDSGYTDIETVTIPANALSGGIIQIIGETSRAGGGTNSNFDLQLEFDATTIFTDLDVGDIQSADTLYSQFELYVGLGSGGTSDVETSIITIAKYDSGGGATFLARPPESGTFDTTSSFTLSLSGRTPAASGATGSMRILAINHLVSN